MTRLVALAATALICLFVGPAVAAPMPMDQPVTMNGITTVCTGIGSDARNDPRWKAYPVRIEFSNGGSQYLIGAHVTLMTAAGKELASVDCHGSWVLFQLPSGNYKVSASLLDHPDQPIESARFSPPRSGQMRVVLEFSGVPPNQ